MSSSSSIQKNIRQRCVRCNKQVSDNEKFCNVCHTGMMNLHQKRKELIQEALKNGTECIEAEFVGHICVDRLTKEELEAYLK